ncbi:hypothetical protein BDA96_01G331900 [Sorghum bicolor]|uniref:Uncharacterized protein n=2 Tax=Sorghum bicolor TaxID=4558 RepID=A0A921V092_SORBI|nr:hypothetical protein BDA96_01G331900 [Sorghum bicolor]OQU92202.1 hypothetical protein SORBI_3001G309666 [Sorghum bicolor]
MGIQAVEHKLESSRQPCISHVVAEGRAKKPHLTLTGFILNPKSQLTNHTAGRIMPRDHEIVATPPSTADAYVHHASIYRFEQTAPWPVGSRFATDKRGTCCVPSPACTAASSVSGALGVVGKRFTAAAAAASPSCHEAAKAASAPRSW